MEIWIMEILNRFGYLGIAILIAIENIFPPIPSEIILTFGGFMTTYTKMNIVGVILSATAGSLFGALLLYQFGSLLSMEHLMHFLDGPLGKLLHFKKEDVAKAMTWFDSQGNYTVLFCRCIPIVRSIISIPAGMAHMNLSAFLVLTTIGSIIWNTVLVGLGALASTSWQQIGSYVKTYSRVAVIVTLVFLLLGWILHHRAH